MLQNNKARLNIWLTLDNKFDYLEMSKQCNNQNLPIFPVFEFAKKVGMLLCAKNLYPELDYESAYSRLIKESPTIDANTVNYEVSTGLAEINQNKTCCGGGKVR